MKLWEAQQVLCRYDPEVEVYFRLPDGRVMKPHHIEDFYPRSDLTTKDRCPMLVATGSVEFEYETTSRSCGAEGVDKAKIPIPPHGNGWELVSATIAGNSFYYFWRRPEVSHG